MKEKDIIKIPSKKLAWKYKGWSPLSGPILELIPYPAS